MDARYRQFESLWDFSQDCFDGEQALKTGGRITQYLPPTEQQRRHPDRYAEYVSHAIYENNYKPAIMAAVGLMQARAPSIQLESKRGERNIVAPDEIRAMIENGNLYDDGFSGLKIRLNTGQMLHGRYGMLLDVYTDENGESPRFCVTEYPAPSILDGGLFRRTPDAQPELKWALLAEDARVFDRDAKTWKTVRGYRVVGLDEEGFYYQASIAREQWKSFDLDRPSHPELRYPTFRGQRFRLVPLTVVNTNRLGVTTWTEPPLLDLARLGIHSMRVHADLRSGQRHCANPTLVVTGEKRRSLLLGAGNALFFPNKDAGAEYLQPNGAGFDSMLDTISDLRAQQDRFSVLTVLDGAGANASGKAMEVRMGVGTADIAIIDKTSAKGLEEQLVWACWWAGMTREQTDAAIGYEVSTDYLNSEFTIQTVLALAGANREDPIFSKKVLYILTRWLVGAELIPEWEENERIMQEENES